MNIKSLIGLILFLGAPFLSKYLPSGLMIQELAFWVLLLCIILWIYLVEKRQITSIGWQEITSKTAFVGFGLGLVLFILFGVLTTTILALGIELNQDVAQMFANQSIPVLLLVALRAGIVEEVLYRAYAFERLFDLTKSKWLAILVPVILFMLGHIAWGVGHLIFVFFGGMLFMLVYVTKRNLPMLMIAHFTTDVFALLVLPLLIE